MSSSSIIASEFLKELWIHGGKSLVMTHVLIFVSAFLADAILYILSLLFCGRSCRKHPFYITYIFLELYIISYIISFFVSSFVSALVFFLFLVLWTHSNCQKSFKTTLCVILVYIMLKLLLGSIVASVILSLGNSLI